ncbi:Thioesterase/thiol ester dehydrase-isomerase [Neolentinus lepideus HHB14362 ss-1]|uniref:Thioesterase/thiol ester dehydrase-isomerase n=1 Tax=Neolentinus lepideus HHB14362 ss-1 TaxID=1314782 RepID=A0A165SQ95_9AGAM|nr:Thioesterase/thiol ester dehydrase-isomerase [Neolentinus lepideus HHB14362 ss-1]
MLCNSVRHRSLLSISRLQTTPTRLYTAPSAPRRSNTLLSISLFSLGCTSAYVLGSLYPPTLITYLAPRSAPPPLHPSDPRAGPYIEALEDSLQSLPLLSQARSAPDAAEWYETRPYTHIPEERRVNSLTVGALNGPGKLALRPLVRARRDESEAMVFLHLGRGVCGHEGLVHGGLLATILDEGLGRVAIQNLPEKVGVTGNLNINYRAPTQADQFVVIKAKIGTVSGRKAAVSGRIEDMNGKVLVEATATFIQPRYATLLNKNAMKQSMGHPNDETAGRPVVEGELYPTQGKDEREA